MSVTTSVKKVIDDRRILSALLRSLTSKKEISEDDLESVLDITIKKVVDVIGAQAITVFLLGSDDKIHFQNVYYSESLFKKDEAKREKFKEMEKTLETVTIAKNKGIVGKVITSGEPYLASDVERDEHYLDIKEGVEFDVRSMITVPLKTDKTWGAIQVLNKEREELFTREDQALLEEVANYSAKIIEKTFNPKMELSGREMASYVARLTKHDYIELGDDFEVDEKLIELIGIENIQRYNILPLKKLASDSLKVAMPNPLDLQKKDSFQLMTKLYIEEAVVVAESDIKKVLEGFTKTQVGGGIGEVADIIGKEYDTKAEKIDVDDSADEESKPIVQLANRIIEDAYSRGASDIHIEPFETETMVRYRVDGVLEEKLKLPQRAIRPLVARLKIMSELDIAESRLPQDGRIRFKDFTKTGIDIDLRVATAPMAWGEKIVMRILDKKSTALGLNAMGFSDHNLNLYRWAIKQPYGMILNVGPTGSGKTTTLYSALTEVNKPTINIQTAEDPVEYMLKGINQMQVKKSIGLTFASALRSYLRQDPDVIMVGEIRDLETAEIAIEAALTGHLMFSTLHTNDAPGTVIRFLDMGVEPFLVSSSLLIVCAQRLLRRLCKCKEEYEPDSEELDRVALNEEKGIKLFKTKGCPTCNSTGYKGRTGTHEMLTLNDEMRKMVIDRVSTEVLKEAAIENGMITLFKDTVEKIKQGITSIEEGLRVVRKD